MATTTSSSVPTGFPVIPCQAGSFPTLDLSGLNGTVCAVSQRPSFFNISSCCSGAVQVVNNCTQYCETDENRFSDCLSELGNGTFIPRVCQQAGGNAQPSEGGSNAMNGTTDIGAGTSPTPARMTMVGTLALSLGLFAMFL